jgi:hypothetical protein
MIKMRLQGVEEDIVKMVNSLKQHYNLLEVSAPYKNRGESQFVRVYISVRLPDRRVDGENH